MTEDSLLAAQKWLNGSLIRKNDPQSPGFGGVCQGYHTVDKSYPYVYSEISGYAISAWIDAWQANGDAQDLERAEAAAEFCLRLQLQSDDPLFNGAVAHGLTLPGYALRPMYYSFDNAMILQGLLDLHAVRPNQQLLESARAIGLWLVNAMQQPDGSYVAVRVADPAYPLPANATAFGDGGCLHAKHTIGLLKLYQASGDALFANAVRRLCEWVLTLQDEDGAIQSTAVRDKVVTHTHCYATEGLLYAGYILNEPRFLAAARAAGLWLLDVQNRDGSISIDYKQNWWQMGRRVIEKFLPKKVSDATAQAVRIWLILDRIETAAHYRTASQNAAAFLARLQTRNSGDPNADGGIPYWPGHPMQFAWSAMFAIQALRWLSQKPTLEKMYESLF